MSSQNAICLLSDDQTKVNLRGYAKELDLLDFKLDTECAVVAISNIMTCSAAKTWYVIEELVKISSQDVDKVKQALLIEYEMACTQRHQLDKKRVAELIDPTNMKRAKVIQAYPSDPA